MFNVFWEGTTLPLFEGGVNNMAKCDICNKETTFGNNVSHSVRRTSRTWKPNIKKVRIVEKGTHKRINVCTRCIRSNKVSRAI